MGHRRNLVEVVLKCYSEELDDRFDEFASEHASAFRDAKSLLEGEHSLELSRIHEDFCSMVEGSLSRIVRDQGATMEDLYKECKEELERDGPNKWAIEFLLASASFERFHTLMLNEARRRGSR